MHTRCRLIAAVIFAILMFVVSPAGAEPADLNPPEVTADAAVLMDAQTGQVLYDKNMHQRRPPASTTKIMTALLALEGGDLKQKVIVSPHAASVGEASIHLQAYEELTLEELLYGALLRSGNDACVAIAEHIAGSEANFVNLMNYKAKLLGGYNTNFCNTNGLPDDNHYSSAYDLALFTRYAMGNKNFCQMVHTRQKTISGPGSIDRHLTNTNKLLWSYSWVEGVKTGTTDAAGQCLVTSAQKEGRRLICVVLHSRDRYRDTLKLLNYGFENFTTVPVILKGEHYATVKVTDGYAQNVPVIAEESLYVALPKKYQGAYEQILTLNRTLKAPVRMHSKVGELQVRYNGQEIGRVNLITACETDKLPMHLKVYKKLRRCL